LSSNKIPKSVFELPKGFRGASSKHLPLPTPAPEPVVKEEKAKIVMKPVELMSDGTPFPPLPAACVDREMLLDKIEEITEEVLATEDVERLTYLGRLLEACEYHLKVHVFE
jgi:hypothetical protein